MGAIRAIRGGSEEMTGTYFHNLDAKGRLFVPAHFREELGSCFYVAVGANREADGTLYQYLDAYPMSEWNKLCEKLAALPSSQTAVSDTFFANAAKCEPDSQNRFKIPEKLLNYAHLEKEVAIVGNNKKAKIWNADVWKAKDAVALSGDRVADMMELLGF